MYFLIFYPENVILFLSKIFGVLEKEHWRGSWRPPKISIKTPIKIGTIVKTKFESRLGYPLPPLSPFPRRRSVFSFTGKHPIGVYQVNPVVDFKGEKCAPAGTQFFNDP